MEVGIRKTPRKQVIIVILTIMIGIVPITMVIIIMIDIIDGLYVLDRPPARRPRRGLHLLLRLDGAAALGILKEGIAV